MLEKENPKKDKQKKKKYQILMILFVIGFLFSMAVLSYNFIVNKKAEKRYQELTQTILPTELETESEYTEIQLVSETETDLFAELGIEIPDLELDWEKFEQQNDDIYSYIYIPNTKVSEPVLQHESETDYYLYYNIDHSGGPGSNAAGCIYTQIINNKDYTDNHTILYGHNMRDGSRFKTLHYFADETFFAENRYIYIYTPEQVFVYEIFAACEFSNEHLLYKYDFSLGDSVIAFTEEIKNSRVMSNQIRENITITEESRLLTLSTCIANKPNNRWLVVGVFVGEKENN